MATRKILVIDDEVSYCQIMKKAIESKGDYQVLTASDGRTGKALARKERPDLILLDIVMPEMSGSEVAEDLLEDPVTRNIPIIFVTAIISGDELSDGDGTVGNRTFIAKPIVIDDLMARIEATLSH